MLTFGRIARWREAHSPELSWLSVGEQARLAGFGSPARREQFVAGRWLMRELLARIQGGEPVDQLVDLDDAGRSCLPRGYANLSHSGEWLVVVHADSPVGIDLERLRPRRDLPGLARMVCSTAQCESLTELDGDARLYQFYRWWTLKEAWLKARGRGLDMALMRELTFKPCAPEEADACSTLLPQAGLALAISTEPIQRASLPSELAGELLTWRFFRSELLRL